MLEKVDLTKKMDKEEYKKVIEKFKAEHEFTITFQPIRVGQKL